ncbi:GNAT family N-acetyltransferase [Haliangium ochraceum]|uniref:GCN5-related N-acetyltransferase n=1 Tax=Haliangium ochraceum (strain DSM 14365 / JCM 11303 / SMP-2) TaxID=502025 RepID=D0LHQ6_HALO1|nr:GNAT family N-acetyltransferase [Haliangium ochraceum]ACY12918.1 GCN5-related N-acetyltransferase [Haliangium ochraceum DSM 14365]
MHQRHYQLAPEANAPDFALPSGFHALLWTPPTPRAHQLAQPRALGRLLGGDLDPLAPRLLPAWVCMHHLRVFRNRDLAVYLASRDGRVVHRSCALPAWYRLPFMAPDDLQIAATFTAPEARGQGLARAAVSALVARFRSPGRSFWYFADADNRASQRVIEQCGFRFAGEGVRTRRLGLAVLGQYVIDRPV